MLCEGILITIMLIGLIPSILMILPYPEKYRREKQYRENSEKTEIIECESSDCADCYVYDSFRGL